MTIFVMNLSLQPGEAAAAVTARAENGAHRFYDLTVEYVGQVAGYEWMSAVVLKLGDDMGDAGDVLLAIKYRGAESNRVRIGVGHLGGGPADDAGAFPTPAPPFSIGGFARDGVAGIGGVSVTVGGASVASFVTGADGSFALGALPAGGRYTLTPSKPCYSFSSGSFVIESLYQNTSVTFAGAENRIDGRVIDAGGQPIAAVSVALGAAQPGAAQTAANGSFAFACLTPGDYTVTPTHATYDFAPVSLTHSALAGRRAANFTGTRKQVTVRGRITRPDGAGLAGVTLTLSGSQSAAATADAGGNYSFGGLAAGGNYTVAPSLANYTFAPASRTFSNLSANQTGDFAGVLNTHSISGRIVAGNNNGLAGVAVTLTGAQSGSTQTDAGGNYTLPGLPAGGSYTVTPTLRHHGFPNSSRTFDNLSSNQTADFTATLNAHAIRGRVLDAGGAGLAGVIVTLGGTRSASATTDAGGNYSFANLPAGGNFTFAANKTQYDLAPASRAYNDLGSDQTADFAATLSRYTISGRLTTPEASGVGGATVSLVGAQTRTATTGPDGGYSFDGVIAKGNYTLTASRVNYDFNPAGHAYADLAASRTANFTGVIHRFLIRGRVSAGGQPLASVHVNLTGAQTSSTVADAGGNFSFSVPAEGDYTVTPSPEHFYAYAPPARSLAALAADGVADFSASPVAPPATQHVLDWDGSPKTVDYNYFFNSPDDLGHFFWEFWAMPGANAGATYLISDGYGGAHAVLFGFGSFNSTEPDRYQLIGNVWQGSGIVSFVSDEGPAVGEWGHFAVGWDGIEIVTYLNGVPVGLTPFAGPRREGTYNNGAGRLLIGGSDHNNLIGRIAQVRGFEGGNPREDSTDINVSGVRAAFAPDTVFRTGGQMLSNYFEPRQTVPDNSAGLAGVLHGGRLRGTPHPYGLFVFCEECPRPQYVVDPTAPDFATATDRSQRIFNPPPAPSGALAHDTFSRRNSTHALGAGGLGQTESGATGRLPWQSAPAMPQGSPFGILNERAVVLANRRALAWVTLPPASLSIGHDLRVRRRTLTRAAGLDTGIAFRVADADNYYFAYTTGGDFNPQTRTLNVGYYLNGQRTELAAGLPIAGRWTELRVVTTPDGAIRVYADSALVYSTTHGLFAGATGAGLYNHGPGLGLTNRWDDFAAYEATAP